MADMSSVIIAKSDQLNGDDLISGPRTVTIREVRVAESGEQRVSVFYQGDSNKPWKPCKTMCRVMVDAWGPDSAAYVGRSLTLYRDPEVLWAGMKTGGIRISHMSHIERDRVMALTATKGKKAIHQVRVLRQTAPQEKAEDPKPQPTEQKVDRTIQTVELLEKRILEAKNHADLNAVAADATVRNQRDWLREKRPELSERVEKVFASRLQSFGPPSDDDDFPGVVTQNETAA